MFKKYKGKPVRLKSMIWGYTAIAEGFLLATFKTMEELHSVFPNGNYKKIE